MTAWEGDELAARVGLMLHTEPGDQETGRLVGEVGALEAAMRSGVHTKSPLVQEQLARAADCGAHPVWPGQPGWPTQLDDLGAGAPLLLWVRGRPLRSCVLRSIAIVGSRACTRYGRELAETIASDVALRGWSVVSGGAFGIDAAAHAGALAVAGTTVLVSAAGVDEQYPRSHQALYRRVYESGTVVSEFALGSRPHRGRFLARNRVIAALSRGTVIVEAAKRSGARATAHAAGALNRHVMAVPGPVTSDLSVGCHELIRDGVAVLVRHAGDCLDLVTPLVDLEPPNAALLVLQHLTVRSPSGTSDIAQSIGLPQEEVQALLVTLEGAGLVMRRVQGWVMTEQCLRRMVGSDS